MTDKFMQAADAAALVLENVDGAVETYLKGILPYIRTSSMKAVPFIISDMHPNPDVQDKIAKSLENFGYKVTLLPEDEMKISWSK
jgi:hypothetical protein